MKQAILKTLIMFSFSFYVIYGNTSYYENNCNYESTIITDIKSGDEWAIKGNVELNKRVLCIVNNNKTKDKKDDKIIGVIKVKNNKNFRAKKNNLLKSKYKTKRALFNILRKYKITNQGIL